MKLGYIIFLLIMLSTFQLLAQNDNSQKYILVSLDSSKIKSLVGYSFCKTQDKFNKQIYVFSIRYNLQRITKSKIDSDADFMFVFYIIPKGNKVKLTKISNIDTILNNAVKDIVNVKNELLQAGSIDDFNFKPVLSHKGQLFGFVNADIFGQAFNLKEEVQYFPEYKPLSSNRYELNLLKKPYIEEDIKSLQKKVISDTSGFFHFDYDRFDGKWNIKAVNKVEKSIVFWINLVRVATGTYSFGRFATEVRFKINIGITDFKVIRLFPFFDEKYNREPELVQFNFKQFVDLKTLIN